MKIKGNKILLSTFIAQLQEIIRQYGDQPVREVYIKIATGGGKK